VGRTTTPPHDTRSRAVDLPGSARADRDEIERFRHEINLVAFAAARGYAIDKRESSRSCCMMRHPNGDKIAIGKAQDGHWQYYSFRDDRDNGDVINFVQHRAGGRAAYPLGAVRKELRAWTHTPRDVPVTVGTSLRPVMADRESVVRAVERARVLEAHPYLESRGLTRHTLASPRFLGTWRRDAGPYGNVIFPHQDEVGICGFEAKNEGFTGFARGGTKGLWVSREFPTDERLVITESAIDALSYHQINPHPKARYVSFAGAQSRHQTALLETAISQMPPGSVVVAATDNDKDGHAFARSIALVCYARHGHVTFQRHVPTIGKDWNDHLAVQRAPELEHSSRRLVAGRADRGGLER
jgi:hypothetical protein